MGQLGNTSTIGESPGQKCRRPSNHCHRRDGSVAVLSEKSEHQIDTSKTIKSDRKGLRIFLGTANLGNALPDPKSLSAWLPEHGRVNNILHPGTQSSSVVDGVSREDFNGVDNHGKFEIIALGMQEAIPSADEFTNAAKSAFVSSGLVATFTGVVKKERDVFTKAFGKEIGKPMDSFQKKVDGIIASGKKEIGAEIGGTKELKESICNFLGCGDNSNDGKNEKKKDADCKEVTNTKGGYILMSEYQRGEMVLYLFVRKDLESIASVSSTCAENTGIGGIMANKGGITTTLTVGSTRLSFLCMHLEAHEGSQHYKNRNSNIREILKGTGDPTITAHHCFIFGDLNYRTSLPLKSKGAEPTKTELKHASQKIIINKNWRNIYQHDELTKALREKEILDGFETPVCKFNPTFKLERKDGYHYDWKRVPSYTDRILWKSIEQTRSVEAIVYEPIPHFTSSDHKPMRGVFFLPERQEIKLDPKLNEFCVTLSNLKCKNLKMPSNLLQVDCDTYLQFRCDPPSLLIRPEFLDDHRTETFYSCDHPTWSKVRIKMSIDVEGPEKERAIPGSYIYVQSMLGNRVLGEMGDEKLGTSIIDLESLVRASLGVKSQKKSGLEYPMLRNGRSVGTFYCDLEVSWSHKSVGN